MTGVLKAKVDGLWTPISTGGSDIDEVWVGSAPPAGAQELWYKSDEPTPSAVDRWNSAWGIVAMGTASGGALAPRTISTTAALTNAIPFTTITGRRYRLTFQLRAITAPTPPLAPSFYVRDNGVEIRGWTYGGDPYMYISGAYVGVNYSWLFHGDNAPHSFEVLCAIASTLNLYLDYLLYYLEDVGPISYGIPPVPDPTPTTVSWTPVSLLNGWIAGGPTEIQPGFRKVNDMVQLKGSMRSTASSVLGQAAFGLPMGYYNTVLTRVSGVGFLSNGTTFPWRGDLATSGQLIIQNIGPNALAADAFLQMNGISWPVGVS